MGAFTIKISGTYNPGLPVLGHGGPKEGGHAKQTEWYNHYGMDLGAAAGTEAHAAFDAIISRLNPHNPAKDASTEYGAQIFMRSENDMMGGFYTHLEGMPRDLRKNSRVTRGDFLGRVMAHGDTPHLHLALVEIVGGLPGGVYTGIDNLYNLFLEISTAESVNVTFMQDGSQPIIELD